MYAGSFEWYVNRFYRFYVMLFCPNGGQIGGVEIASTSHSTFRSMSSLFDTTSGGSYSRANLPMLKRVAHAFLAFFFGQGLGIAAALLLVPLYLHVWSPALYGEWLPLYSVVAYLTSLDLGVQTYAVNRLTQAYARGDLQEYRQVQHTAFAFYFCLALLGSVALTAFGWWAPIRFWFHLSLTDHHSVALIVLLLGGQFLWSIPASLVWSVYATTGNLAKTQWVTNASSALSVALTVAALLFWPRLAMVAGAQAIAFISIFVVIFWDVHKHFPQLAPGFSQARLSLLRTILNQSVFFALIDVAVGATLQGSNLIVAGLAGTTALALFVTTRTLANSIRQLVGLFVHSSSTNLIVLEAPQESRSYAWRSGSSCSQPWQGAWQLRLHCGLKAHPFSLSGLGVSFRLTSGYSACSFYGWFCSRHG